jgi:two-component system CheB/CheR fusion protein
VFLDSASVIAAIGASAGGIEALRALLRAAIPGSGVSYIVQMHLAPDRESSLAEILARDSALPVENARDGQSILPDRVLVIPPGATADMREDQIILLPQATTHRDLHQIDALFSALALAARDRSVGVVLSGFGSDGTLGIKAIKEHGGLTIAQGGVNGAPGYPDMPESAISGGLVDLVLPAKDIPAALAAYAKGFQELAPLTSETARQAGDDARIQTARRMICDILRRDLGHDFSGYKESSFLRRVQRRMQVLQLSNIADYAEKLSSDHEEARQLLRDLLINVTDFFRDTEAFAALAEKVIPGLFKGKGAEDSVRVWVPGCATGEEAYSIAMLLSEYAAALRSPPRIQVFATDIDEEALQIARAGYYTIAQLDAVPPGRLERFFQRSGSGRVVTQAIRDICTFSVHNLLRDPPFSRLDLISCRNLLIYLEAETQKEVFPIFHFALRPGGFLFLGGAESAGQFGDLFRPVDKQARLYQRRDHAPRLHRLPMPNLPSGFRLMPRTLPPQPGDLGRAIRSSADAAILERFAPAHVVINQEGEIIHFSAHTGRFLEPAAGQPTRSLLALARRGLRLDLRTAMQEALQTRHVVSRHGMDPETIGQAGRVSITVEPLADTDPAEPLFLVVFHEADLPEASAMPTAGSVEAAAAAAERELRETRERLQTLIEEYETAVEELRSSNEELVSVNEELQSANEELETSKEEQQSVNEELQTVNQELQAKVEELDRANSDMRNLFDASSPATIILTRDLLIRGFTPAVKDIFNLLPADRGRPFQDIAGSLDTKQLLADARAVLEGNKPPERRISSRDIAAHYLLRTQAYLNSEGKADGVLLTLLDVTQLVEAVEAREHQRLLVNELNHRVRNMLQVVIGLTSQTLREDMPVEEFGKLLLGRMMSLSRSYQIIAEEAWGDVSLQDLVKQQLDPHLSKAERASVAGPAMVVSPAGAVALGLVLHELATNAVKYGALSSNSGKVAVSWAVFQQGTENHIRLEWRESGGPKVETTEHKGFGSGMIKGQVERALKGHLALTYGAEGFMAVMTIPLDATPRMISAA